MDKRVSKEREFPQHQIVGMLANGDTFESLLRAYPTITLEDVRACLEYVEWLAEEQCSPLEEALSGLKKTMQLSEVIWKEYYVDKIEVKHGVSTGEVEEVIFSKPHNPSRAQPSRMGWEHAPLLSRFCPCGI